jgi:N-acetylneuraminic acid mutarotase
MAAVAAACTGGGTPSPSPSPGGRLRFHVALARFELASPRQREVAVLANDTIYLAGGLNALERSVNTVSTLNPVSGEQQKVGQMPQAFHDAAGAVMRGRLFVFGGGSGESSDLVQAFDFASGRASVVGHLPKALSDVSAAPSGSAVYLVGGFDGHAPQPVIYSTLDGIAFRIAGRLPVGLRYAAVASLGGQLVIAGGVSSRGPVSTVYLFDPADGKVSVLGELPERVGHATAFAIGGIIFVAGGLDASGRAQKRVFAIDLQGRTISVEQPLQAAVSDAPAVSDGTHAWIVGGWRGKALTQVLRVSVG